MTDRRKKSPYAPPTSAEPEPRGLVDQTRSLYEQLAGEAVRRAERERAEARERGPVAKALIVACVAAALLAAGTMVYGIVQFPDAPIRQTAGGFAGKQGRARTRQDFERFVLWEKMLIGSFAAAFATGFAAAAADKLGRRKRDGA